MAKKITKTEINVKEFTFAEVGAIIKDIDNIPFEEKVGALVALETLGNQIKSLTDTVKSSVDEHKYKDICDDFVKRGLINAGDVPVINVGAKFAISISEKEKTNVVLAKNLKDIDSIIPSKYKEVKTSYDKEKFGEDYLNNTLDSVLRPYVTVTTETKTTLSKKTLKP